MLYRESLLMEKERQLDATRAEHESTVQRLQGEIRDLRVRLECQERQREGYPLGAFPAPADVEYLGANPSVFTLRAGHLTPCRKDTNFMLVLPTVVMGVEVPSWWGLSTARAAVGLSRKALAALELDLKGILGSLDDSGHHRAAQCLGQLARFWESRVHDIDHPPAPAKEGAEECESESEGSSCVCLDISSEEEEGSS